MNFLAQMPSRSDLTSLITRRNGMTGYVNGGEVVDTKFDFRKVLMPSPTALPCERLINAFGLVLAVGPGGIY